MGERLLYEEGKSYYKKGEILLYSQFSGGNLARRKGYYTIIYLYDLNNLQIH